MHLLHLEDSRNDAELVEHLIRREWPDCSFLRVGTRAEYEAALERGEFNLILSDYTLPDFNGLAALELARRRRPDKPFIFLSGTIGEERAIEALRCGATDYVLKDRPNRIVPAIRQALALRDEMEQRLRSEERVREQAMLLAKARDAICATDFERRVTYWNASTERLFGWSIVEALGRDLRDLLFPGDATAFNEASLQLQAVGEWRGELRPRTKSGEVLIVESHWTLVGLGSGGLQHLLLINTDVTEKKKLEAQFLRAQRIDSIGTLAGGIAHDLNNVLNPILIAAGLLRDEPLSPSARSLVEAIEAGGQHGAALIRQLLAFARGADGVHVELQSHRLVSNLSQMLRPTLPGNIQLAVNCAEGLWRVRGDATQLNQVLLNLCINARDALPHGGRITIFAENFTMDDAFASTVLEGTPGPYVRLTVADNGTGMSPEVVEKIFDPFFTTKGVGKGTGLGLSTVRGIVKGHRGCLQVESEVGRGTTFRLYLPAVLESAPRANPPAARMFPRDANKSILIIDDDDAVRNILRLLLENAGYRVLTAAHGAEGLATFQRHRAEISLVITDMMMPEMSGPEVIEALRKTSPDLKIIAISGLMDANRLKISRVAGPSIECLAKPITSKELFAAIERAIKTPA